MGSILSRSENLQHFFGAKIVQTMHKIIDKDEIFHKTLDPN